MTETKTWFITGAGRGMGVEFAKAALAAGHKVVATGRNPDAVAKCSAGRRPAGRQARRDQRAGRRGGGRGGGRAVRRHRRAGQQRRELLRRLLRGADTRADAPAVDDEPRRPDERDARRAAGDAQAARRVTSSRSRRRRARRLRVRHRVRGVEVRRRRVDGVAAPEVEPFGITRPWSTRGSSAPSCSRRSRRTTPSRRSRTMPSATPPSASTGTQNGSRRGDPAKLAQALLTIAGQEPPPLRFIAGADAIAQAEQKLAELQQQIDATVSCRRRSRSTRSRHEARHARRT